MTIFRMRDPVRREFTLTRDGWAGDDPEVVAYLDHVFPPSDPRGNPILKNGRRATADQLADVVYAGPSDGAPWVKAAAGVRSDAGKRSRPGGSRPQAKAVTGAAACGRPPVSRPPRPP